MRLGIDGRKIPESRIRGPIGSLDHGNELGMDGLFFRTVLDIAPTLDMGILRATRQRADELDMYLEMGLGKVNPFATPETPELRAVGDGDILLGFRRMMEACAAINCRELWVGTANYKPIYPGRYAVDRFRTDVTWPEQLEAIARFLAKLAPIARDLGIHINLETHEEITSFEIVRLVEQAGTDAFGIVYDTSNGLQRLEHPVMVAKRVAPYVRQTHFKDLAMVYRDGCVFAQSRPCGRGVIDFGTILQILAAANPDIHITIENEEPHDSGSKVYAAAKHDISDPAWLALHPDLSVEEYAAYIAMVRGYEQRIASGELPDLYAGARDFGYEQAVADIAFSAAHLRGLCEKFGLPMAARQKKQPLRAFA
jgi:sugar phosphate isomerase/epimerase